MSLMNIYKIDKRERERERVLWFIFMIQNNKLYWNIRTIKQTDHRLMNNNNKSEIKRVISFRLNKLKFFLILKWVWDWLNEKIRDLNLIKYFFFF
jgi:hypothetical protein